MDKRTYSYDLACEDLAAHFLAGKRVSELDVWGLAQAIQDAVDAWIAGRDTESLVSSENVPDVAGERG